MDVWGQIWPNRPKAHISVIKGLTPKIGQFTLLEQIWAMVELSGIEDETDRLLTYRALRDIRNKKYLLFVNALMGHFE